MNDIRVTDIFTIHRFITPSSRWDAPAPRAHHFLAFEKEGVATHFLSGGRILVASENTLHFLNRNDPYRVEVQRFGYSIVAEIAADNAPDSFIVDCSGDSKMSVHRAAERTQRQSSEQPLPRARAHL